MNLDNNQKGILWFIAVLIVTFILLLIVKAHAHDHNHPEMNEWLTGLHSKDRTWCCTGNDHDPLDDWNASGDHYRVKYQGEWYDVPDEAVVGGPNKMNEALLWMNKGIGRSVRCFMPGTMG